jgi:hypothetical protein
MNTADVKGVLDMTIYNEKESKGKLQQEFGIPPFSVFDCKQKYYIERKKFWKDQGLRGDLGRSETVKANNIEGWLKKNGKRSSGLSDLSIFDPVLTEFYYKWYCPKGGTIVDPFCGGSTRGFVASKMGLKYVGIDVREIQIDSNVSECEGLDPMPEYILGDSLEKLSEVQSSDLVFTCPPYGDLETYSDLKSDISNLNNSDFRLKYSHIILETYKKMKQDSFAVFVVGNYRNKKTYEMHDMYSMTANAFFACGAKMYNSSILSTQIGSAAMTAAKPFRKSRKLTPTHQNVLVFCKGDIHKAIKKLTQITN